MAKRYGHIGDDSLRQAMAVLDHKPTGRSSLEVMPLVDDGESMTEKSPDKLKFA